MNGVVAHGVLVGSIEWERKGSVRQLALVVADVLGVLKAALLKRIGMLVLAPGRALGQPADIVARQCCNGFDFDHESSALFARLLCGFDQLGPNGLPVVAHFLPGDFPEAFALDRHTNSRGQRRITVSEISKMPDRRADFFGEGLAGFWAKVEEEGLE